MGSGFATVLRVPGMRCGLRRIPRELCEGSARLLRGFGDARVPSKAGAPARAVALSRVASPVLRMPPSQSRAGPCLWEPTGTFRWFMNELGLNCRLTTSCPGPTK